MPGTDQPTPEHEQDEGLIDNGPGAEPTDAQGMFDKKIADLSAQLEATIAHMDTALAAARRYKAGFIEAKAVEMGVHDADLDMDHALQEWNEGTFELFAALAELDGKLNHEQPIMAEMKARLEETVLDIGPGSDLT